MKYFFAYLSVFLISTTSLANQPLVPMATPHYFRLTLDPVLSTDFAGLNRAELAVDFAQRLGGGFDWGTTLHGGAASNQLFINNDSRAILGLDLMGRYFGSITDVFFIGMQLDLGYTHYLSAAPRAGMFGVRLSTPIVASFEKSVAVYFAPGLRAQGSLVDTKAQAASVFAQSLGASMEFGAIFYTYGPGIFLNVRPIWPDVRSPSVVASDFSLGLAFDM